jgi:hypothetical protein
VVVAGGGEGNGGRVDDMIICLMKPFEIFGVMLRLINRPECFDLRR